MNWNWVRDEENKQKIFVGSVALNLLLIIVLVGHSHMFGPSTLALTADGHPLHPVGTHGELLPPPPPLFRPAYVFTPQELREDDERMLSNYRKVTDMHLEFARQLETGDVSKEDVLKFFSDVDQMLDSNRKATQDKIAEKIGTMTHQQRQTLAQQMVRGH